MVSYGQSNFSSGYMGTAVANASGYSYVVTAGVPVLTVPVGATTGIELPIVDYSNEPKAEIYKIQNSKSGPQPLKDTNYVDDENIELTLDYDFSNNPFLTANGGLQAGQIIKWLILFLNQTKKSGLDGKPIVYSQVIVESTPVKVETKGGIVLKVKLQAAGPFWMPPT